MAKIMVINGLEIFRIIGIVLIVLGFIYTAIERFLGTPFMYGKDQINGITNGFVVIVVGVVFASNGLKEGIILGLIIISVYILEYLLLKKIFKSRYK